MIKIAFEDAGGCDQDLIDAIIHSDFALVSFLLNVVFKSRYSTLTLLISLHYAVWMLG